MEQRDIDRRLVDAVRKKRVKICAALITEGAAVSSDAMIAAVHAGKARLVRLLVDGADDASLRAAEDRARFFVEASVDDAGEYPEIARLLGGALHARKIERCSIESAALESVCSAPTEPMRTRKV